MLLTGVAVKAKGSSFHTCFTTLLQYSCRLLDAWNGEVERVEAESQEVWASSVGVKYVRE